MRIVWFTTSAAVVSLGVFASMGGCGLDPLDGGTESPPFDAAENAAPRDSGGPLVPEPGATDDSGADATSAPDAAVAPDAGPCPSECSSCTDGACQIDCPGPKCGGPANTITCPLGRTCRVVCNASNACKNLSVTCAAAMPCSIHCETDGACEKVTLNNSGFAANICVDCAVAGSCDGFTCVAPLGGCSRACGAFPDQTCGNMTNCGGSTCTSVDACP